MTIHWHRRDLRVPDNQGLAEAATEGAVVPVFVFDDDVLAHASPPRMAFLLDALGALRDRYRALGTDLLVRRGDPATELQSLADESDADRVTACQDYSGLARRRDDHVGAQLETAGADLELVHDHVLQPPMTITTNQGEAYSLFSYYADKWAERSVADPVPAPDADQFAPVSDTALPTLADLGFEEPEAELPPAGTVPARERLQSFCDGTIYRYGECRDSPASDCTSHLSVHLKYGTIGIREIYDAVQTAHAEADSQVGRDSVAAFEEQLAWREFYTQVLYAHPETVRCAHKSFGDALEWETDESLLQAWKDGRTGYPLVDAGMRQLREEAFVHNRVRMLVASFLTKDLQIDWRKGYAWFKEKLVDHDTANDVGGWQWAASTGVDAQPYFRIFNPTTHAERHDPDATYITRYVPELREVPTDVIHAWPELDPAERDKHAPEYAEPIVDHAKRREQTLEMFERAREA